MYNLPRNLEIQFNVVTFVIQSNKLCIAVSPVSYTHDT